MKRVRKTSENKEKRAQSEYRNRQREGERINGHLGESDIGAKGNVKDKEKTKAGKGREVRANEVGRLTSNMGKTSCFSA